MKTEGITQCPVCVENKEKHYPLLLASERDNMITCEKCDLEVPLDVSRKMGFTEALEAQRP